MKQNSLEKMLQQDAPPPDPAARLAARRAALAEFARVHPAAVNEPASDQRGFFQGLLGALRLSRDPEKHGSDVMPWYQRRMLLGGAASVCLAILGGTVVWTTLRNQPEVSELTANATPAGKVSEPVGERPAAATQGPATAVPEQPPVAATPAAGAAVDESAKADARLAANEKLLRDARRQLAEEQKAQPDLEAMQAAPVAASPATAATAAAVPEAPATASAQPQAKEKDDETQEVVVTGMKQSPQIPQTMNSPVAPVEVKKRGKSRSESDDSLQEVIVTGAGRNAPPAPHKGVAPARPGQQTLGGLFRRNKEVAYEPAPVEPPATQPKVEGNDKFEHFDVNPVRQVADEPVSTFSADVDTSSYSFIRKQLDQGILPQKDAVRAEEMINYFEYSWPAAESREQPFKPTVVVSDSPWGKGRKLVHIGIKGYELPANKRPDANLVMLLDVSGSMDEPDKLPLVKQSMKLLLGSLKPTDSVAIVVYAGAAGLVLPPTPVGEKEKIVAALDSLTPGGSTAGAEGIELAYQLAEKSFRKEGVNRILLCTDGDFNVGIAGTNELKGFVERKRATGIFLSVLGFGQGNYRDELAQALAQNGNGVAAYIDTLSEAQKVLVKEAGSSLFTIAKDVKFQVEFNPATVAEYRLVGYETRALRREDFNNDAIDAGDIGSGHAVTAIYEITPVGVDARMVDESRYSKKKKPAEVSGPANEYGFLKMRYKLPGQDKSQLIQQPISIDTGRVPESIQRDVGFSTAVAGFAQLLRGGQFTGSLKYDDVIKQALATRGEDPYGYRNEFVQLVRKAQAAR